MDMEARVESMRGAARVHSCLQVWRSKSLWAYSRGRPFELGGCDKDVRDRRRAPSPVLAIHRIRDTRARADHAAVLDEGVLSIDMRHEAPHPCGERIGYGGSPGFAREIRI